MSRPFYDNPDYKYKQASSTKEAWKKGVFDFKRKSLETKVCLNDPCKKIFYTKPWDPKKYCSHSCAARINNLNRPAQNRGRHCFVCNDSLKNSSVKYCSVKCQNNERYLLFIKKWRDQEVDGNIGIKTKIISGHLRRYLMKKYKSQCSLCGWNQRHLITGKVPLEVNHIDGNADNNTEENLELLCPNCHSLTPNFRNLNKGHGRKWRLSKTT